jgi:hypothetical protein
MSSAAGISNVVVKDYLQGLSDENQIRVEKIGSGNWYWCFMSDEKIKKETALVKAEAEKVKALAVVEELQAKVDEAVAEREEDEDEEMESGNGRESMMQLHAELGTCLDALRTELAGYSENDPVEVERRRGQIVEESQRVDALTDAICSMEGWFKQRLGGDKAQFMAMKQMWYGDEFDEEAGGLREI